MYTKEHRAFQLGWEMIKSVEVPGDGVQAPGAVTMCSLPDNPHHPFVVHFFNAQDGGFHSGDYCEDRASAEEAYAKRVLRFNICSRCGIAIRPEGGHLCGTCGRDI